MQQWYDGDGLRVKKSDNGAQTYYLRSSVLGGQVVAEIAWTGAIWQWNRGYVYLGSELLAVQQGGVFWMHEDPVTKSKRVTNSAGTVVSTVELDPWGVDTNRSNNGAFQPKKFTSYNRDNNGSDEAMFRRSNRWHSRFDQPDPYDGSYNFTNPQSLNRYAYVQNDPVNFVDPNGLDPFPFGLIGPLPSTVTIYGSFDSPLGINGSGGVGVSDRDGMLDIDNIGGVPGRGTTPQDPRQIKEVTDCDLFAAEVDRIALANADDYYAFMRGLKNRFNAEGEHAANTEFASTGFKDEFRDDVGPNNSANQVRHYVGGLRAVFAGVQVGSWVMSARERHGTPSNRADLRLNEVSKQHALALANMTSRPTDLANMIRRDVCAKP